MSRFMRLLLLIALLVLLFLLATCERFADQRAKVLKNVCEKSCPRPTTGSPSDRGIVVLLNQAASNNPNADRVMVPKQHLYITGTDGLLYRPGDHTYESYDGMLTPQEVKVAGLNPKCFVKVPLPPEPPLQDKDITNPDITDAPHLSEVDITVHNSTITFLDITENGAVESWEIDPNATPSSSAIAAAFTEVRAILDQDRSDNESEYALLQQELSKVGYLSVDEFSLQGLKRRDTGDIPGQKTPFYRAPETDSDAGSVEDEIPESGHIYIYVLLDKDMEFNRDVLALVPYTPEVKNSLTALRGPFIQYPIYPAFLSTDAFQKTLDNNSPEQFKLDVMVVHFYPTEDMRKQYASDGVECRYPYDLGVKSKSQSGADPLTPLLIDPEVRPRHVLGK